MASADLQPPPRTGLRRFLSPDIAVLTMLAVVITVSAGLAAGAVAGHFALAAEVRQTHARIDETNARIDNTNVRIDALTADMNTRFDRMDAKIDAQFDRIFTLLQGTLQEHGRRLDAIERRLAETASPSEPTATP